MRRWLILMGVVAVAVLGIGAALFEPWRLFTSSTLDEALPSAPAAIGSAPGTTAAPATPRLLARGEMIDAEHATSGEATIVELPNGDRLLRLENLTSSDGPDLHVWLTDIPAGGEWGAYDDGRVVRLGTLKATHGNQNYPIPADTDLAGLRSAVIWCDRFNVAFGTAPLDLAS